MISKVMENDNLSWISPVEDAETQESDLFTLLGAGYTSLRYHNSVHISFKVLVQFLKVSQLSSYSFHNSVHVSFKVLVYTFMVEHSQDTAIDRNYWNLFRTPDQNDRLVHNSGYMKSSSKSLD